MSLLPRSKAAGRATYHPTMPARIKSIAHKINTINTASVRIATVAQDMRLQGAAWRRLRRAVLMRAKWMCECRECRELQRIRIAHEVDHVTPVWEGGTDHRSNLQAINRECHAAKSAAEATRRAQGSPPAARSTAQVAYPHATRPAPAARPSDAA